jgi:hypothetical protein
LNCKVERSCLTDELDFCQLLDYTGDADRGRSSPSWSSSMNFMSLIEGSAAKQRQGHIGAVISGFGFDRR